MTTLASACRCAVISAACVLAQAAAQAEPQRSAEVPKNAVPQNSPCSDQMKSLAQLQDAFAKGSTPSPADMTGSWVAISLFGDTGTSLNCSGIKRGPEFEEVMLAKGYSLEMHVIGTIDQSPTMTREADGSVTFPFGFGGDASPVFRCRMTARGTLACLIDVYREGLEFQKMTPRPSEIHSQK